MSDTGLEPDQHDYRRLSEFRYLIQRFLHFSEQLVRLMGLEPQQHQLLLAVKGMPAGHEPTIGDVAERLQLRHHSTVELVDRLMERGLVERCRANADRRQVLVRLTLRGEEVLREISVRHLTQLRNDGPELSRALAALIDDDREVGQAPCGRKTGTQQAAREKYA